MTTFYELYEDKDGHYVDGRAIRPFLNWELRDRNTTPRYAKCIRDDKGLQLIQTYLDSELTPVEGSEWQ